MSYESWPSPDAPRGPLPRIDDLPIAEQGYEQEAVREAFDSFYRHAAQLDASLKALEAVEAFRREATELRADLRSIRSLGYGGLEPAWTPSFYAYDRPRREIPSAVPRIALEVALLIGIAVAAGVAHFRAWVIVAVMAAALVLVALSEWLAGRARYRVPAPLALPEEQGQPAPYVEAPPPESEIGWSAFEPVEPGAAAPDALAEEEREDELTAIGIEPEPEPAPEPESEPEAESEDAEPVEPEPEPEAEPEPEPDPEPLVAAAAEPEPDAEPQEQPRRRWFRRQIEEPEPEQPPALAEPPSHVRVLAAADPWERGFDGDADAGGEGELAERGSLGRIRRRRR